MPAVAIYIVGLMIMIAEGAVLFGLGIETMALHSPVALTMVLGLRRQFESSALTLALLIPPIEWLVAGVPGVYGLGLVVLFFLLRGVRTSLQQGWGVARATAAAMAAVVHIAVMMMVLAVMGLGSEPMIAAMARAILWSAPVVAIMTVVVGRSMEQMGQIWDPRGQRSGVSY